MNSGQKGLLLVKVFFAVLIFLSISNPILSQNIIGIWKGTSICADHRTDIYCKDENVIYESRAIGTQKDSVELNAFKTVNGKTEPMYEIILHFDKVKNIWWNEFVSPRFKGRWEYTVNGKSMKGVLIERSSRRLVRDVSVVKE